MVRLIILATTGLVLNCCCVIIPLSSKAHGLAAQPNVGVNAIATPACTTAQDPLLPAVSAISVHREPENNGGGTVACRDFRSPAAAPGAAYIQLEGSDKNGRSCQSLP
jgi:hypothetical protein